MELIDDSKFIEDPVGLKEDENTDSFVTAISYDLQNEMSNELFCGSLENSCKEVIIKTG